MSLSNHDTSPRLLLEFSGVFIKIVQPNMILQWPYEHHLDWDLTIRTH
jgi:hypothetical protein